MASISGLAVLVVEDQADSRELLELFLEGQGATVRVAGSAAEAREVLGSFRADVILTDVTLPGEDGFAFIAELRANPSTKHIPAVAVTGHSDDASRKRALNAGFQNFLPKPFDVFALPAVLESAVAAMRPSDASDPRHAEK